MKRKVDWFTAALILIGGGLAVVALIAFGESEIAWLIP